METGLGLVGACGSSVQVVSLTTASSLRSEFGHRGGSRSRVEGGGDDAPGVHLSCRLFPNPMRCRGRPKNEKGASTNCPKACGELARGARIDCGPGRGRSQSNGRPTARKRERWAHQAGARVVSGGARES